jgi:hypothetical protein
MAAAQGIAGICSRQQKADRMMQPEPQAPRKRKVAKIRPAQPMRVAQQPHFGFGFFGSNTW